MRIIVSSARRLSSLLVVFWLTLGLQLIPKSVRAGGGADVKSFSHDAHGLEKQFEPLMKAYAKGKTDAIDKEFAAFVLPNANKWFADYFPADKVEQLGWDYESEANNYKSTLPGMMRILAPGGRFHAQCSTPDPSRKQNLKSNPDAPQPVKEIPLEQFEIKFVADSGRSFSILANFVYVEGAYRYLGKGAYPFWSMPDATRKK